VLKTRRGLAVLAAWVAALEDGAALTVGDVLALVLFCPAPAVSTALQRPCRASALAGPTEPVTGRARFAIERR
jgi:hypothetical protein